jgi:hypothetical protein
MGEVPPPRRGGGTSPRAVATSPASRRRALASARWLRVRPHHAVQTKTSRSVVSRERGRPVTKRTRTARAAGVGHGVTPRVFADGLQDQVPDGAGVRLLRLSLEGLDAVGLHQRPHPGRHRQRRARSSPALWLWPEEHLNRCVTEAMVEGGAPHDGRRTRALPGFRHLGSSDLSDSPVARTLDCE